MLRRFALLFALSCTAAAAAEQPGLDLTFGAKGYVTLRDTATGADPNLGIGACAAPGNTLDIVAVTAYDRLATFRLLPGGALDTSYGTGGVSAVTVAPAYLPRYVTACLPGGAILVARAVQGAGNDTNLELLKLGPDGQRDTSFGTNGVALVDLDAYFSGLGSSEQPYTVNVGTAGEIYLGGNTSVNALQTAFLVRLTAAGAFVDARLVQPPTFNANTVTAAGIGGDGRLWVAGAASAGGHLTWYRVRYDANSGQVFDALAGSDGNYGIGTGRVLPSGVMVLAARYVPSATPAQAYAPRLIVLRDTGPNVMALPPIEPVGSGAAGISNYETAWHAIPIAGGRVLVGEGIADGANEQGLYASVVELGATAAGDRVYPYFGSNGAVTFAYRVDGANCADGAPPYQHLARITNWLGKPTVIGTAATTCAGSPQDTLAVRLVPDDRVFTDGFGG